MCWTACLRFVEDRGALTLQSHAVRRGDDAAPAAVEQPDAERVLQFHDRFGNAGLRDAEVFRRLAHAAGLDHSHEHFQVAELETPLRALGPWHRRSPHSFW